MSGRYPAAAVIRHPATLPDADVATLLHEALCAARAVGTLRRLTRLWPNARAITERLAAYLTEAIPNPALTESLLVTCLRQGRRTLAALPPPPGDRDRLLAWLRGVLQPLPAVLDWRVVHVDTAQVWDPLGAEPLLCWRQRGTGQLKLTRRPPAEGFLATPDSVRLSVACRLLHGRDLDAIGGRLLQVLVDDRAHGETHG